MKKWKRAYKEKAVQEMNPEWRDLYYGLMRESSKLLTQK